MLDEAERLLAEGPSNPFRELTPPSGGEPLQSPATGSGPGGLNTPKNRGSR
jgi:hypothetical protein